ncbi:MAG: hypothetical protein Q9M50_06900 [Methylococcales bacterium]|nr:hypothetical protein [Methylococcales bacterium]
MKIKEILPRIYDDRQLRALTGLKTEHFILLLSLFEKTLIEDQKEKHEKATNLRRDKIKN